MRSIRIPLPGIKKEDFFFSVFDSLGSFVKKYSLLDLGFFLLCDTIIRAISLSRTGAFMSRALAVQVRRCHVSAICVSTNLQR